MLASEILKVCEAQGVILHVVKGNRLKIRAPKGRVDETLLKSIRDHKEALIQTLKGDAFFEHHMDATIAELDRLHVDPMAVPKAKRREALEYDRLMTEAANENRPDDFMAYLEKWRECFH